MQVVAFITESDLSAQTGLDLSGDLAVPPILEAACDLCRNVAGQPFNATTGTAVLDGTGTDALLLPNLPVSRAGTVLVNGGTVTDYALNGNGILLRGTAGVDPRPVWPLGRQNVTVVYDYGYATVPSDVKMVALSVAARLATQGQAIQEMVGDVQVRYNAPPLDLSNGEKLILQKYRQTRPA
jgi:hypothetical protein